MKGPLDCNIDGENASLDPGLNTLYHTLTVKSLKILFS